MNKCVRVALLACASAMSIGVGQAWAQADIQADAQGAGASDGAIEEVVVTAQKREQRAIDVPIALTAYSGQFLKTLGVQDFAKLSLFVPGFQVQDQSPNNPGFVMRGITSDSGEATQEPRVSVFQDGVSISKSRGSYIELFDVQRIEVAKGPQSTLFGRGALIGAVNIIQNKADPSALDWSAGMEFGDYDYKMGEAMVNLPITDDFAIRIAGRVKSRDGYTTNFLDSDRNFNSVDTKAVRLSADWQPTSRFKLDVIANYERDTPNGTGFKSGTFVPTDPATGAVLGSLDHTTGAALASSPGFENDQPLGLKRTVWGVTSLADYQISEALKLSSISAYRKFHSVEIFDPDGFSLPLVTFEEDAKGEQTSQEFRLNYDDGGMVSAFGGVSYFHENGYQSAPAQYNEYDLLGLLTGQITRPVPQPQAVLEYLPFDAAMLQGLAAAYGAALDPVTALGIASNLNPAHREVFTNYGLTNAYDVYGDVTVHVAPKFEVEAGLRYSYEDKTSGISASTEERSLVAGVLAALKLPAAQRDALLAAMALPGATYFPDTLLPNFGIGAEPTVNNGDKLTQKMNDGGFTWRLTGRYKPDEDTSLYASYARGRRPDVLSASAPTVPYGTPVFTPVDAETVDSYEVGAKAARMDGRLSLDGAVYYYTYDNFQTIVQKGALIITANAGTAKAYGFEGQMSWAIADAADVFATYSYNHSRLESGLFKGNHFRLSPDNKLSIGMDLRSHAIGGTFTLTPTFTWQSLEYFDDNNDKPALQADHILPDLVQDEYQKSYGLANVRLSYQMDDSDWRLYGFVNNIFDQKYIKDAGNTGDVFGIPTFIAGEPRFYGVGLSIRG